MFCPHCGKRNEEGARHCSSCGERLPELGSEAAEASGRSSLRARIGRLIGGSRRERVITAAIVIALGIAIVAVVALATGDDQEEYVEQADRICVESKQALATVRNTVSQTGSKAAPTLAVYGAAAAEIAADWRSQLAGLDPPSDRQEAAAQLDQALGEVEAVARKVARQAQAGGDPSRLGARLAAAGAGAEQAIEGLEACAEGGLGIGELEKG